MITSRNAGHTISGRRVSPPRRSGSGKAVWGSGAALVLMAMAACTPTVQVAPPTEPITINLNVRIEHEIRVRVDRELDDIFSEDSGLF